MTRISATPLRTLLAIAALGVATHAASQDRSAAEMRMTGTWQGEFSPSAQAPVQRFITVRRDDGTFSVHARMYQGGRMVAEVRNAGLWGISNGMYFTVTTDVNGVKSDPKSPEATSAYLVQALEADRFDYVHVASGSRFVVRRIDPAAARLPD